uniref:Uncharacterized protein n=1 Tax=Arundo donax TaxID=35708 RepID=A0A0A9GX25_ARUDO
MLTSKAPVLEDLSLWINYRIS